MSDPVTIQDIYDLFKASREEYDRRLAEADRRAAEAKAEADRRAAEADRRAAEAKAEADRRAAEADRRAAEAKAEADRRMENLERIVANTSKEVGRLGDRWGLFVENLVEPAVRRLFQERGIDINHTFRRAKRYQPGVQMEIDILGVNGDVVVAIEVKSRLGQEDVDRFCEKLTTFRQAFPEYRNYQLYGAVGAIEILETIDRYAYQKGLFVIRQCGDSVEIANDGAFRPRAW